MDGEVNEHLIDQVLGALKDVTGLEMRRLHAPSGVQGERFPVTVLELRDGLVERRFRAVTHPASPRTLPSALQDLLTDPAQTDLVLVTSHVTPDIADRWRRLRIQFLDAAGNAHLRARDLFVLITGRRPSAELRAQYLPPVRTGGTPAALRVMFVLLCDAGLVRGAYRDIAEAAGVALGGVGPIMENLAERGLIVHTRKKSDRRLLQRMKMLDEWVTNYPIRLRPKLHAQRFRAPAPDWWTNVDLTRHHAQWGGEVAADRYVRYLRPSTCTVYVDPNPVWRARAGLVIEHRLRPDPTGDIELIDRFWTLPARPDGSDDLVPAELVYADLMASVDARAHEAARMLLEKVLSDERADSAEAARVALR